MKAIVIPHRRQRFTWDCGLACVEMVLKSYYQNNDDDDPDDSASAAEAEVMESVGMGRRERREGETGNIGRGKENGAKGTCLVRAEGEAVSLGELTNMVETKSVWTIDLAFVLQRFNVDFVFYTITTHVEIDMYANKSYYQDRIHEDLKRVNRLFQVAKERGINVVKQSISWRQIEESLRAQSRVAIVLVDVDSLNSAHIKETRKSSFAGHYIVLIRFDSREQVFEYLDPARGARPARKISPERLDKARKQDGTDEDILILDLVRPITNKL